MISDAQKAELDAVAFQRNSQMPSSYEPVTFDSLDRRVTALEGKINSLMQLSQTEQEQSNG